MATTEIPRARSLKLGERELAFEAGERQSIQTLIVESNEIDGLELRESLLELGYGNPHVESDHVRALKLLQERPFTHILFTASYTNMEAAEFVESVVRIDQNVVCIPTSYDPQIDDVFLLLQKGSRWFLVKPYTSKSVDEAMLQATKGEGFSESLLFAEDRNAAFSALIASNIDRAARAYKDARKYDTAKREQAGIMQRLRSTAKLAQVFAEHSENENNSLANTMVDFFSGLASGPATRLGRVRKRLSKNRGREKKE